jgi:hypothetical protein
MFGAQYVSHQGDYSPLQREHYRQLVLGLSRWASQAPLSDPALAQASIAALTAAAQASGLDGTAALQAAGMEPALQQLAPVQQALLDVLASYGLDLRQSLAGLQVGPGAGRRRPGRGPGAVPAGRRDGVLPGADASRSGRWYMQQNLEDAQKALAAAANARQQRQLEDNAPAPAAAQDAQMASAP